ncbi:putative thioredoxin-dependent peroxiredoxin [Helianthus anomalus]
MYVHLTKPTKFLVRVRLFNKRTDTNELPVELFAELNDMFVMKAWKKSYPAPAPETKNMKFLADGSATYTHALGLELDRTDKGLGVRSRRFALLVDNLKVVVANIESADEFTIRSWIDCWIEQTLFSF